MDRNADLGDPAFVSNPVARLTSAAYAATLRTRHQVPTGRRPPPTCLRARTPARRTADTTHYSVVDARGDAVSVTYTLNFLFGANRIAGDTGFFLNDEMDDFAAKPGEPNGFGLVQGRANAIAPGKRPLSSMSPTIVLKDNALFMATGSPGGSTIISTVLESILNVVDFGMNVQQAVDAPRVHEQGLPDRVDGGARLSVSADRGRTQSHGLHLRHRPLLGRRRGDQGLPAGPRAGRGQRPHRRPAGSADGF